MTETTRVALPTGPFTADVTVPGDKSLGHRALMLAALAGGGSRVAGLSEGADVRSTVSALRMLGVERDGDIVHSPGFVGLTEPIEPIDCGNSGTTMRLLTGLVAGTPFDTTLVGDASLTRRPMRRLVAPLGALGARIELSPRGTAPITVRGGVLAGAEVVIGIPSAQVRTAVALAALNARGTTSIDSPAGFRDHTERWLVTLGRGTRSGATLLTVEPGPIPPLDLEIPGDPSSAAYLWAAAVTRPGSSIRTRSISLNPGRLGFLRLLEAMGAEVSIEQTGSVLGDPVGHVTVRSGRLVGVDVGAAEVASAIDELPLLAVVAACAEGVTRVSQAGELRTKESDRLTGAVALARLAGGSARLDGDGFVVGEGATENTNTISAADDHRIAMSAAIAAVVRRSPVEIAGFDACAVSWPGFRGALEDLWS